MTRLRGIIIDDNAIRRESVREVLPDYVDSITTGAGDSALAYLKRDAEGKLPDFLVLGGDDPKGFGLYIFDWMINKSGDEDIAMIPVIVLTEDEFSEKSLEFLEIGDVFFYEGEIEESRLFSAINDAIETSEFLPPPAEPVYEETKSIDRLMGLTVKAPGDFEKQRSVVLDMETRVKNLEAALERGRKRVDDIRTLLDAAKKTNEDEEDIAARKKKKAAKDEEYIRKMSAFLDKARKKAETAGASESIEKLREKAMSNPSVAYNAQGTIRMEERPAHSNPMPAHHSEQPVHRGSLPETPEAKKTVVITDGDLKTRKLCALFLTQKYNVVTFDSAMKTIDYFVKNSADLLLINPVLSGMSGVSAVLSIRLQSGGANVPVMYLVGDDFTQPRSQLMAPGVVGILNKPIKQGVLSQSVEGLFNK